jgi:carbamoyl-phosphate synthase small subunit
LQTTEKRVTQEALLGLEDGSVFRGVSVGAPGWTAGEVVFNTAMTGYQEILTDPSYCGQMVTLTYPHIGNVGANPGDEEAGRIHAAGLIIRAEAPVHSNYRATGSLGDYLRRHGIVAIGEVDTRRLTRLLRTKGSLRGAICAGEGADPDAAVAKARATPSLQGADLARVVTTNAAYDWTEGSWVPPNSPPPPMAAQAGPPCSVVAYDFGVKRNILRMLVDRGCRVHVVPATTPAAAVLALKPDGVFLSNGPGDPEPCDYAIAAIRELLAARIPLFGICLGHQLLGLAAGARTVKMKFGHHGANHPVVDVTTRRVFITSQNHGFMVDEEGIPSRLEPTHRSLFDGTLQGMRHRECPAFSFQGHPEASPGPHDVGGLFDLFVSLMRTKGSA